MNLLNHLPGGRGWRSVFVAAGVLLMLVGGARLSAAQTAAASLDNQEVTMTDLLKLEGKVLGEGTNTRAVGKYKVTTYRLEEITLPQAVEVEIRGQKMRATQAFRVTVTGGPFAVRAMPPVIWIDDTPVGYGVENEDLDAITAVTFDAELLREGATLYLSYGDKEDKSGRVALPEKLKLAGSKGGAR